MNFIQHRPRDLHSLFGWIKIKRAYYHCQDCRSSSAPYDAASGLSSEQLSPGLAKACCMLSVNDSFEQTSRKIEALIGQKVSDNTVERVVQRVGSVGACKNVVGKRLKQSGMIWTRTGSSLVLALRVTWLNDRWEQLWKEKPLVA
jgi:hypothetical protein